VVGIAGLNNNVVIDSKGAERRDPGNRKLVLVALNVARHEDEPGPEDAEETAEELSQNNKNVKDSV